MKSHNPEIRDSNFRRRLLCVFPVALFLVLASELPCVGLELPEWDGNDRKDFSLSGALWPGGFIPTDGGDVGMADAERLAEAASERDASRGTGNGGDENAPPPIVSTNRRAEDLVAVSRPPGAGGAEVASLRPVSGLRVPTPMLMPLRIEEVYAHELPPIEGTLKDEYFGKPPSTLTGSVVSSQAHGYLVDPQQLMTEQKSHDIQRFLEYHADEAQYDICLMLFGGTQEIPDDISLQQKLEEWFGEAPVVLVAYFLEHPERTEIHYGPAVKQRLPQVVFDRIFQSCVREAQVAETAFDQVERFAIELSIRLYWMAKLLDRQSSGEAIATTQAELSEPDWQELAEQSEAAIPAPVELSKSAQVLQKLGGLPWLWLSLCGMVFVSCLGTGWWWWRRDSLAAKPMLFPELEVPSRLGGLYSGGGFVGMSFDVSNQDE